MSSNSTNSTSTTLFFSPWLPNSIPWEDCFYQEGLNANVNWLCANLTVPIDYLNATSNATTTIGIARGRPKGLETPLGALFANRGGPAGDMIMYYVSNGAKEYLRATANQYDIVLVDPRGVGWSQHLTCGYNAQTWGTYQAASQDVVNAIALRGNPLNPESLQQTVNGLALDFGAPCSEYEDHNYLAHMNTPNVVRDMHLINALMNYTTFDFWGWSYGTVIGTMYAQMYPENVGKILIDGVVDYPLWTSPISNAIDYAYYAHSEIPRILSDFAAQCVAAAQSNTNYCPLAAASLNASDPTSDLISRMDNIFANLTVNAYPDPESDIPISLATLLWLRIRPRLVAPEHFQSLARYFLHVEEAINSKSGLDDGDTDTPDSFLPTLPDSPVTPVKNSFLPKLSNLPKRGLTIDRRDIASMTNISTAGWNSSNPLIGASNVFVTPAVSCLDWNMNGIDNSTAFVDAMEQYIQQDVIAGFYSIYPALCLSWPNLTTLDVQRVSYLDFPTNLSNKLLVIGVTEDPVTPYSGALNTYEMLGDNNAVLLRHEGFGHSSVADPSNCTWNFIIDFFVNGSLPQNGTVCSANDTGANNVFVRTYQPTPEGTSAAFRYGMGIGLLVGIPLLLGLIFGGLYLRRRRKKRAAEATQASAAMEVPSVAESKDLSVGGN